MDGGMLVNDGCCWIDGLWWAKCQLRDGRCVFTSLDFCGVWCLLTWFLSKFIDSVPFLEISEISLRRIEHLLVLTSNMWIARKRVEWLRKFKNDYRICLYSTQSLPSFVQDHDSAMRTLEFLNDNPMLGCTWTKLTLLEDFRLAC